mmetsp:Transcript_87947/g.223884  ORF Transcript_87947/g.223884 Transcript_87947/m.223884 type:complete len:577 (-) Transcript_87947:35-1765(-)
MAQAASLQVQLISFARPARRRPAPALEMRGVLNSAAAALLWPLGIRRRYKRKAPREPGDGEPPREDEEEGWELDLCHFLGTATGALMAWWALAKVKSANVPALTDAGRGAGLGPALLPRLALSDFLRLLSTGAVTTVTYMADKPPAGSLLLTATLPAALLVAPVLLQGKADECTTHAETLLIPGCHQTVFEELRKCSGLHFECGEVAPTEGDYGRLSLLIDAGGLIASLAALWYVLRGNNSMFSGKHLEDTAHAGADQKSTLTFDDVAGMEGTKEELREVISFLRNPSSFYALGARPPRGLLLAGPSGTGKTLLARAVAGEAGVPFLYASSAAFVEVFVGQGAQRIRQFFQHARSCAPCIVFLDELDAVGAARQPASGGGNQEYCQTLNQLLLELDGVESHSSNGEAPLVVTIAATNRYDCLDEALVRPGRLDRIVLVGLPGLEERVATLQIHARKLRTEGMDFEALARRTKGKSGADLANLLNEAALLAARGGADAVRMEHVSTVLGKPRPEQKSASSRGQPGCFGSDDGGDGFASASRAMAGMFAAAAAMAQQGGSPQSPRIPRVVEVDASSLD